jgi:sugar lactone lactonase YvrE
MKHVLLLLLMVLVAAAAAAWIRYGGGEPYPDLTGTPVLQQEALEEVLSYPLPIGNVAVSATGRVFFTVHPEARSKGNKLLEFTDGAALPYPDARQQAGLFDTVLGVAIDRQGNLWTIDHGNHGTRSVRLLAFELDSGEVVHDHRLPAEIAPAGSFLQDLQVSADGRSIIIADASFWRKRPAIIVYDVESSTARRVLESHPSVSAEKFVIAHGGSEMRFFGGLVALRGGIDGIALGPEWLYYGALSGSSLYRVRLSDLRNNELPPAQLARRVEQYSAKPLSDGLSTDVEGNVYVTDVEHSAIFRIGEDREPITLVRSPRVRWPDALSFGPDGWLYVADSAQQEVVLQPQENIEASGPYGIFRFRPGAEGVPGQ